MKPQKILLIEPNQDIAETLTELLTSIGMQVKVVDNINVLLTNTSFDIYDMVIVDTDNNCSINGELARRRRNGNLNTLLYIVGCYCIQDRVKQLIQLGIDGVHIKPIDFDEMMFDIERVFLKSKT
jgi:DNA-binding response OmpR family regulator